MSSMAKSKRKQIKDLAQSKIVDISNYRELSKGREAQKIAIITDDKALIDGLKESLGAGRELEIYEGRFPFEQKLKSTEWDAVLLDQRLLKDDTLLICEKMKRQNHMEEVVIIVLSDSADKELVREGLEKGCDEWLTRVEDTMGVVKLIDHYLSQ